MGIQKLNFAEPFFEVYYVEREAEYFAAGKSLIFNLAERSQASLYVKGIPMAPSGLHREHARAIDEVHAQIRGFGKVQRFA